VVYDNPAVRRQCLRLKDEYGIDVNLLLFCAFVGAVHAALDAERVEQAMLERWSAFRIAARRRAQPAEAVADNIRILLSIWAEGGRRPELPYHLIGAALAAAGR
jgi:uncharacterized protein (TIGR02444 family)